MRPLQGKDTMKIPLTFDTKSARSISDTNNFLWVLLLIIIWIFISISAVVVSDSVVAKLLIPVGAFIVALYIARFVVFREFYFKEKRSELIENDFKFGHNIFWDIYDISDVYPYIVYFNSGIKGIFVLFDKDVIVGKQDNAEYDHYEAIAEANQQMTKRGMYCIHIDYMDTLGKDERMEYLFDVADGVENPDLKMVLMRLYDNIQDSMYRSFSSYDVYCFLFGGQERLFKDELAMVLKAFSMANFSKYKILGKDDISELVKSIMNIDSFSLNNACQSLFMDTGTSNYIRAIWVERNKERKILNKTLEEIAESLRVNKVERKIKKSRKGIFRRKKNEDIDLFE